MSRIDRGQAICIATAFVSVGVALFPTFGLPRQFYLDWINHLWLIEYFGEFLRQHAALPEVLNTPQLVGSPLPIFYSGKFYAMAGAISAVLGAAVTVRLLAGAVLLLQFWQVHRALMRLGAARAVAIAAAVFVTWAIYPLTNFYNRGALTEFFAVAFLTCALAALLVIVLGRMHDRPSAVMSGLMFTAAAVTHPITAMVGALLLAVIGIIGIALADPARRRGLAIWGGATALLAGIVLSPWFYAFATFRHDLPIAGADAAAAMFRAGGFFPDSIDNIWSRLSPIALVHGSARVSTPYLDAQVSLPLLLLAVALAIGATTRAKSLRASGARGACWMGWSALVLAGFFLAVSVNPAISGWLGGVFDILQFPYRLTTYVNLCLLAAVISLAGIAAPAAAPLPKPLIGCIAVCAMLAVAGVATKLYHANLMARRPTPGLPWVIGRAMETGFGTEDPAIAWIPPAARSTTHLQRLPPALYGIREYSMSRGYAVPSAEQTAARRFVAFDVMTGRDFGRIVPQVLELTTPTLVVTNVQPFRWNALLIDGAPVAADRIMVADMEARTPWLSDTRLAIMVPAGRHELAVGFAPSATWRFLDRASWAVFLLWLAACLAVAARGRRAARPSA